MQHNSKLPAENDTLQGVPVAESVEDNTRATAIFLLKNAIADVSRVVPPSVNNPTEAILIFAHTSAAKQDMRDTAQLEALRELRKSVDALAAAILRLGGL